MAQAPHGPANLDCPMHKKAMSKVCHKCPWWTLIRGSNPQTGGEVDRWDCAIAMLPLLSVEMASTVRGARTATESMRNEIVRRMDTAPAPVFNVYAPAIEHDDNQLHLLEGKQ